MLLMIHKATIIGRPHLPISRIYRGNTATAPFIQTSWRGAWKSELPSGPWRVWRLHTHLLARPLSPTWATSFQFASSNYTCDISLSGAVHRLCVHRAHVRSRKMLINQAKAHPPYILSLKIGWSIFGESACIVRLWEPGYSVVATVWVTMLCTQKVPMPRTQDHGV